MSENRYPDILRVPDRVTAVCGTDRRAMQPVGEDRYACPGIELAYTPAGSGDSAALILSAPGEGVCFLELEWRGAVPAASLALGDAVERSYGDLAWEPLRADRVLPWYAVLCDGQSAAAYGVAVRPNALCWWQAGPEGITLGLDLRCGTHPVELGAAPLEVCTVLSARASLPMGCEAETGAVFSFVRDFCARMADGSALPVDEPVYGGNNWYYAYGESSREQMLRDSRLMASLCAGNAAKPYMVVDSCWQEGCVAGTPNDCASTVHTRSNERFGDMASLAAEMAEAGVKPGLWLRPLLPKDEADRAFVVDGLPDTLDPSRPEVQQLIAADIRRVVGWGYRLIKYDFSTMELFWRFFQDSHLPWGEGDWRFADRSQTTAMVVKTLYRTILENAGDAVLIGCNCVSHLAAGYVHLYRTGDDTSGVEWARTVRMGVNTLAFRLPQHGAFYQADADCVGITGEIPWAQNRQWLDLLAQSGTPLFVSASPDAMTPEVEADLRAAFALAGNPGSICRPLDWMENPRPVHWQTADGERTYRW